MTERREPSEQQEAFRLATYVYQVLKKGLPGHLDEEQLEYVLKILKGTEKKVDVFQGTVKSKDGCTSAYFSPPVAPQLETLKDHPAEALSFSLNKYRAQIKWNKLIQEAGYSEFSFTVDLHTIGDHMDCRFEISQVHLPDGWLTQELVDRFVQEGSIGNLLPKEERGGIQCQWSPLFRGSGFMRDLDPFTERDIKFDDLLFLLRTSFALDKRFAS